MERGRRKRTMERDVEKEEYNGTGWRGVEGSVQWNGMERGYQDWSVRNFDSYMTDKI